MLPLPKQSSKIPYVTPLVFAIEQLSVESSARLQTMILHSTRQKKIKKSVVRLK